MKSIVNLIAASSLLAPLAISQPQPPRPQLHYTVQDLGAVGGTPGQAFFITNNGLIAGGAAASNGTMQAVLWYGPLKIDIGTPGLKGPNSFAFTVNELGQAVGQAETQVPNEEDFCGFNFYGFHSLTQCLPFVWQYGVTTALATLGGANGYAYSINNRGEVAGLAENGKKDPNPACTVSQFEPVVWKNGQIHELQTWTGDTDGVAAAINDSGQVAGASGTCASSFNGDSGLYLVEDHAMLWDSDGTPHDLGNLGGSGGIAGNHACALNNQGEVVGHSELTNNTTFHGFLWTKETGMQDLHTLPGAYASLALGINDGGEVVGASLDASFFPTAVLWEKGASMPANLNGLVVDNPSGLTLLFAYHINASGEIVGLAVTSSFETHGFLATPK
jgi:probable HAF family extracellular repeat protein